MSESLAPLFRRVTLLDVQPLRRSVLRPHMTEGEVIVPGDDAAETWHVGMYLGEELAGIASLYRADSPHAPEDSTAWQVRMFAIAAAHQGQGYSPLLLAHCVEVARSHGASLVWGNARLHVAPLYERFGFSRKGDVFDIPGVCEHVYVEMTLAQRASESLEGASAL